MLKIIVENMQSPRGNEVPNQFRVWTEEGWYFQSYKTVIAFRPHDQSGSVSVYLDESAWNYSRTTGKYRNLFLKESKKETEEKIKSGKYKLTDLALDAQYKG